MKVKICGLTRKREAEYVNESGADYAGFVFYEPSRRYVTIPKAKEIKSLLRPQIRSVAVTVSPDVKLAEAAQQAGFDVLQVHKELTTSVLNAVSIPVWYAVNIGDPAELSKKTQILNKLPENLAAKITAIVVDAGDFGSGKTFDWTKDTVSLRENPIFRGRKFILAGGLKASNVEEGIRLFSPDAVDVSSGVEKEDGKDRDLIIEFTGRVKGYE